MRDDEQEKQKQEEQGKQKKKNLCSKVWAYHLS